MQETPTGHKEVWLMVTSSDSGGSSKAFLIQPMLEGQAGHSGGLSHQVCTVVAESSVGLFTIWDFDILLSFPSFLLLAVSSSISKYRCKKILLPFIYSVTCFLQINFLILYLLVGEIKKLKFSLSAYCCQDQYHTFLTSVLTNRTSWKTK